MWFARKHKSRGRGFKPHSKLMPDKEESNKTPFYPLMATKSSRTFSLTGRISCLGKRDKVLNRGDISQFSRENKKCGKWQVFLTEFSN